MTKQTWQKIYSAGEQLNRYPYDFVVSNFYRYRSQLAEGCNLQVLDLGCGAGNHALFCAENGADVLAVDYSKAALDVVEQRAEEKGLSDHVRVQQVDFENFDLNEAGFDMMIDRLAVSHVSRAYATAVYARAYELLADNAVVLSNLFTRSHAHKDFGKHDSEDDIWREFSGGIFEHLKTACFYSEEEIRTLFSSYQLESLQRETQAELIGDSPQLEIWKIIARKRA